MQLVNASDKTLVPTATNTTYSDPRLTRFGTGLVVGYGQKGPQASSSYAAVRRVDPSTGQTSGSAALGVDEAQAVLPLIGGIATNGGASSIVVGSRLSSASPNAARLTRFSATPTFDTSNSPTSSTLTVDVAWSQTAARYGAAFIESQMATGGMLATYDEALAPKVEFVFTGGSDQPLGGTTTPVGIAPQDGRFVVVWVDVQVTPRQVYISSVDALSGTRSSAGSVTASDTPASYKYYPKVLFDGSSIVVAWLEPSTAQYRIMWRRFDSTLTPLAASQCATCNADTAQLANFGFAAISANDYGVAALLADGYQHFLHFNCTGP
jgi:hypothetical protein